MKWLESLRERLAVLFHKKEFESEMAEELQFHIEQETQRNIDRGMHPSEARREALHSFGQVEKVKEEVRDETGVRPLEDCVQDIRYGVRTLRRNLGFTVAAVITLALGIGANTAIFTVVNSVLLRPLPYRDADRLAMVWGHMASTDVTKAPWSGLDYLDFKDRSRTFEDFAGTFAVNSTLSGDFEPEPIQLGWATPSFFDLLGVDPLIGRTLKESDFQNIDPEVFFDPEVEVPPSVAILSQELWGRRFGSDPSIIGRTVQVNGQPMEIIGVLPAGFKLYLPADASFPGVIDVWSVVPANLSEGTRDQQWLTIVGKLKPGVTAAQAQSEMDGIAEQFRAENQFHENVGMEIDVVPMQSDVVGHAKPVLLALLGAVGFVLLIACANVANLLLVRGQVRQREMAIRAALGGGRGRILRQMLTESAILAVLGGGAGLLLAFFGIDLLLAMRPENQPRVDDVGIDGTVLAFVAGVSLLAAFLFGTLPALQSSRPNLNESLRERGGGFGLGHHRMRNALVVAEVALSLVLLVGAGLMVRTFAELSKVKPGFDPENVLTLNVALPFFKYGFEQSTDFHLRLSERIKALPGVEAVGAVTPLPLAGGGQFWFGPYALNEASDEEWSKNEVDYRPSLPGLFEAMGTRLLAGRELEEADNRADAAPVVVVDEKLAEEAWPGKDAVGEQIMVMRPNQGEFQRYWATVVGVVEHTRYDDIRQDGRGLIYFPHKDWGWAEQNYVIRAGVDPAGLAGPIRSLIRELDPDIPASRVRPMAEYVGDALASTRFALILFTVFAGTALFLSALGLYGVISYSVRQRTREIGVRMAFGAERQRIVRLVLGQGLLLTGIGVGVGLVGAVLLTRVISSLLFGVTPTDPITYATITVILAAVALLACYVPAERATRVDPLVALRAE